MRNSITIFKLVICLLLLCASCLVLRAQQTSLRINISDKNGDSITNSIIQLQNKRGEIVKEIASDATQREHLLSVSDGEYTLTVRAAGFKPFIKDISLNKGSNTLNIILEVEDIKAEVNVTQTVQEKRFNDAISREFTSKEIENLPDTPEEITNELQRKYGDDIVIRINGFTGGQMPPKEQIASIKVIKSSFDAEFHSIGQTIVDIRTKAGGNKWFGFFRFDANDYHFNSRNAFSKVKLPEQTMNFVGFLGFPTFRKKTSITISLIKFSNFKENNFLITSPDNKYLSEIKTRISAYIPFITVTHNINEKHTINLNYFLTKNKSTNLGVGGLNLPERAFSSNLVSSVIQLSEIGTFSKKYVNQFYLQFLSYNSSNVPSNLEPSITVLGTYSAGGSQINNQSRKKSLSLRDNFFFDSGKQSVKWGGELLSDSQYLHSADNTNGSFIFLNIEDYRRSKPYQFSVSKNVSEINASEIQGALFFQDDIRLRKNFQFGIGIRYEIQNQLLDYNNFSPRLNFVWSPTKKGTIVLRDGIGIFYQWLETETLTRILSGDNSQTGEIIINQPGFPVAFDKGITRSPLPSIIEKDSRIKNPYSVINKYSINYHPTSKINIEGIYTFRRGLQQFRSRDINSPLNGVRPNSAFGQVTYVESSGRMTENSLEIKTDANLGKSVIFDVNYKLGKITSNYEDIFGLPSNSYNISIDESVSNLDQRHKLSSSLNLRISKLNFSAVMRLNSPKPINVTTGLDNNKDGVLNDRPLGVRRNSLRAAWSNQVDVNIGRSFRFSHSDKTSTDVKASIRNLLNLNIFIRNIFNNNNKQDFIGVQTSPLFLQPTSSAPARTIQLGLTYIF